MCYTDCFLFYFTIRAGSSCVSSILLALGIIGCILVPVLPFSGNRIQFCMIMAYMILLVIAFTVTLCGSLTDSKVSIGFGLLLGVVAFILWMTLTIPTILAFRKASINDFCLGMNCGESHWLVPRIWMDTDFEDFPTTTQKIKRSGMDGEFIKVDSLGPKVIMSQDDTDNAKVILVEDSPSVGSKMETNGDDASLDKHAKDTISKSATTTISSDARLLLDEDTDWLDLAEHILEGDGNTQGHSVSKRQINLAKQLKKLRESRFEDPRILSNSMTVMTLTRTRSIILTFLYGLLHVFVLITIFMNLASFVCREDEELPRQPIEFDEPICESTTCWKPV
ncbi:uncharacterized protein LOC103520183 isoform X4 [Diaphorina citri]|uniref:Uncharacterized protein LOC103520183 isoform X3 n=1 Tax=Diaphorina citri TaxID=121845 RepID=A0A3Q0JFE8_DIACI|nr:uncharacterized protein LOC103520183 isoform X3 [Diaphorina citri]XP_026687208.1 uncharacterized protein LOC103520183 isoform X4 [Diaphorina citri]